MVDLRWPIFDLPPSTFDLRTRFARAHLCAHAAILGTRCDLVRTRRSWCTGCTGSNSCAQPPSL